jgi:hypothetical protein
LNTTPESPTSAAALSQVISDLRATSERLQLEIDRLTERLGAAVMDEDQALAETLESQLDLLTARSTGVSQELATLEATATSADVRERRRRDALERERTRRELVAAQVELYSGWRATLEHQACVVELTRELEQLRNAWPVDRSRLNQLRDQLDGANVAVDTSAQELESSDDPDRLRAAARHYDELLRAIGGNQQPSAGSHGSPGAAPAAGMVVSASQPSPEQAAEPSVIRTASPEVSATSASNASPVSEQARAPTLETAPEENTESGAGTTQAEAMPVSEQPVEAEPAPTGTEQTHVPQRERDNQAIEQELRRLDGEEQRLQMWRASLERQGDPLGVLQEVDLQLQQVRSKRATLLDYRQRTESSGRRDAPAVPAAVSRTWWQRLGLGD